MTNKVIKVGLQVILFLGMVTAFVASVQTVQAGGKACQIESGVCVHPLCDSCNSSCTFCEN